MIVSIVKKTAARGATLIFAAAVTGIIGCAYLGISRQDNVREGITVIIEGKAATLYNSCVIRGLVKSADQNRPVLVAAWPLSHTSKTFEEYVILDRPGPFMLYLPEGKYALYAVTDYNNNAIFEGDEVSGEYATGEGIALAPDDVKSGIVINARAAKTGYPQFPAALAVPDDSTTLTYQAYNGQIVKLYSERFSRNNASAGWWSPTQFMKAYGAAIYFTEKYSPDKIPVLFIHGAEGSPQDWVYFFVRLNRAKYQPWFYYYPSGIRLSLATALLHENIAELWEKHHFGNLVIAAHSMGGLIARSMVTQYSFEKKGNCLKKLFTFATPWSGFGSADTSLLISGKVLPSWMDMASRSAFIKRTMRAPLPESVGYYLFYGKMDQVSQEKALDDRAFEGVSGAYGFECDHNSILQDKMVFRKFTEIMEKQP